MDSARADIPFIKLRKSSRGRITQLTSKLAVKSCARQVSGVKFLLRLTLAVGWLFVSIGLQAQDVREIIRNGDLEMLRSLVTGGYALTPAPGQSYSMLHYATIDNQYEIAEYLISAGADVNARNRYGATPLHQAASADMARLLVENGADMSIVSDINASPLHSAITNDFIDVVIYLIDRGADLDSEDASGSKPVHYAAGKGRTEALRVLLLAGADPDSSNHYGYRPLHWSAGNGLLAETELLLDHGADPKAQTHNGLTPIQSAQLKGREIIVELLSQYQSP